MSVVHRENFCKTGIKNSKMSLVVARQAILEGTV